MRSPILLLDLGGVLVDLGDPAADMDLTMANEQFWELWLGSPLVQQFETGQLASAAFIAAFAGQLGIADGADFGRRLGRWQLPMFAGVESYLRTLARHSTVALLSNTNEIHWQQVQSRTDVFAHFAQLFLSFETGNAKPQPAAFLEVLEHFGCAPADVVFLDDNANNVAAARANGLRARQVRGFAELRQAVDELTG